MPWLLKLVVVVLGLISTPVSSLECEYYNSNECGYKSGGPCESSRKNITCDPDTPSKIHTCYVLWQRHNNSAQQEVLHMKGCLTDMSCKGESSCVERNHGIKKNNTVTKAFYCCCNKDYCNQEYIWDPAETTTTPKPRSSVGTVNPPTRQGPSSIIIFTIVPIACALVFILAWFIHRRGLTKPLQASQSGRTDEENILLDPKSEHINAPAVSLLEVKAAGRFGHVWKATMAGHSKFVAVKILPFREKASWQLEQDVYQLPLMNSTNWIIKFYGARRSPDSEQLQLWLISEYLEQGSLYDYLKGNVLTWNELFKISVTMCQGLAFLHEEIEVAEKGHKPAVAHRDFKSKNVLLRPDLTACIADFGLAHIFYPHVPIGTCHGQVGTRRYMAPEVLEGAVSFTRDNFQRIDMYACALVLWELTSRCSAQKAPVAEYRLPFEEYIGQSPTLEEMQDIVVAQRKRPTIRNDWKSHPGLSVLVDVMKDAWDQDSEARISASCIVERMNAISNKIIS